MIDGDASEARPADLASVSIDDHGDVAIARIVGEVDISNAAEIAGRLSNIPNLLRGLVVDLSGVDYVDSSGLRMLQELHARLAIRSQRLVVVSPPGAPPRRMLELTALDLTIAVRDTLAAATEVLTGA